MASDDRWTRALGGEPRLRRRALMGFIDELPESRLRAAQRELEEETGIRPDPRDRWAVAYAECPDILSE